MARVEAQIAALQAQLDVLKQEVAAKPVPSWKGAPELADRDAGWSFKPRGRIHYDTGTIDAPGAIANRTLGFNSRIRRVRLGFEGTMPGGFGFKLETDFANSDIRFGDAFLNYSPRNRGWLARIGNFETLNGLDQITSSNNISLLERAAFNDAFINTRRLGAAFALTGKDDAYRLEAGLFAAHSIDGSFDNDGWIGAARAVWAPPLGDGRLHLAANIQHREFQSNNSGTASVSINAPSTNQLARYRARPNLQTTDVRFVDTGAFAARGDTIFGLEAAAIFKGLYLAGEAQLLRTRGYRPGSVAIGLDAFAGGSAVTAASNPSFWGAYGEIGWFITGETRGYGNGAWARTKVLDPLSHGGRGAFQLIARVDHLDLDSQALLRAPTTNFATGATSLAALDARLGRGGTQTGYLLGLNWYPLDYVRLMLNYVHLEVEGGPFAALAGPLSTAPLDERGYAVDGVAVRAQVEF